MYRAHSFTRSLTRGAAHWRRFANLALLVFTLLAASHADAVTLDDLLRMSLERLLQLVITPAGKLTIAAALP